MAGRRNPHTAASISIRIKGPARRLPKPVPSDGDMRLVLMLWAQSFPMPPACQVAINFRLLALLEEKRRKRKPITPMQQALSDVAILTRGLLGQEWNHYQACRDAARIHGVDAEDLERMWRVRRNQP